jgi:hypothetical protein
MASSAITGPVFSDNKRAPSGTAAAPSFAFNDSTGTGVYLVSAGVLGLSTAGVQRVVVDASGNVGVGASTTSAKLTIKNPSATGEQQIVNIQSAASTDAIAKVTFNQTTDVLNIANFTNTGALVFGTGGSGTERMRLDASGNLLVGKTVVDDTTAGFAWRSAGYLSLVRADNCVNLNRINSNGDIMQFRRDAAQVGSISVTASATSFNPSSDRRLKEEIQPMTDGLERVMKLKPVTYKWKVDGSVDDGFIAQDLQAVPEFAHRVNPIGERDGEMYYGVDYMRFVSVLTAAIQEQQEIIEKLEARLAALESKP